MTALFTIRDGKVINPRGLEINVVEHCNLSCRACSHASPMLRRADADPDRVHSDLRLLAQSYSPAFVKVLGGEPLLHRELPRLLDRIRESGITDRIILTTNGVLLHRKGAELWGRIDSLEMSEYPGHEPTIEQYELIADRARTHGVNVCVNRFERFRESYSEVGTHDEDLVEDIFDTCQMAHEWFCHTVHEGNFYLCPQSLFLPRIGVAHAGPPDGLPIETDEGFASLLLAYIERRSPLNSCRNCLGSVGKLLPHQQVRRNAWQQPQQIPVEDLLDRPHLEALKTGTHAPYGCSVSTYGEVSLAEHLTRLKANPPVPSSTSAVQS